MSKLEKQVQDAKVLKEEAKTLLISWESIVSNAHQVQPVSLICNHNMYKPGHCQSLLLCSFSFS